MTTIDLSTFRLSSGGHGDCFEGEACLIEAATVIKGWEFTDHPDDHISPVISAFCRRWNDDLDDEGRQQLKRYIDPDSPVNIYDTAGDGLDERRAWMCADWLVRVHTPAWLDLAGITEAAQALRALPELRDLASLNVARPAIDDARKRGDAAGAAAGAAAWDAAGAAAGAAAWAAAGAAAWAAAGDAAGAAAWAAAGAAAWDAARAALEPTKVSLQESAHDLLARMIDPKETA
ncbi:MAG TPA: hypothetical protein VFT50_11615 [Baekduia sp.]|nr:hypothetical protein [Baekduia sp.]